MPLPLQLYKLSEEFSVSLTMTVPYAIAVFYIVKLQARLLHGNTRTLAATCLQEAACCMPCHAMPATPCHAMP